MTDRTAAEMAAEALRKAEAELERRYYIDEALRALTAESARVSPDREALARRLDAFADVVAEFVKMADLPAPERSDVPDDLRAAAAFIRAPAQAEVEAMIAALDRDAESTSRASKMMADDKSRRNGHEPGAYMWQTPERTVSGRAAAMLRRLSSPSPAVGEWRPIATVPTDGNPVWVGWNRPERKPRVERRVADGGAWWRHINKNGKGPGPSHWMPAAEPAPPQEKPNGHEE